MHSTIARLFVGQERPRFASLTICNTFSSLHCSLPYKFSASLRIVKPNSLEPNSSIFKCQELEQLVA